MTKIIDTFLENTPIETRVYDRAEIEVEILFPMATTRLTQVFVNPGDEIIEAIYQFPVPSEAVLGDVQVKVNHEVFTGQIQGAYQAESNYEEGVAEGKRSVLVKQLGDGLMEVNAGNLAPSDEISITLTIHALLDRYNETVRYHLPTCIAPRYGHTDLDEFHTPYNNLFATYPFTGNIKLVGDDGLALVDASHQLTKTAEGARFKGELNQDISIQLRQPEPKSVAYHVANQGKHYTLASFKPLQMKQQNQPANLQLVVDCSGSMSGRSIEQVQKGLRNALELFSDKDQVNMIRFGSTSEPLFERPMHLSPMWMNRLEEAIEELSANLGGTEIFTALETALGQFTPSNAGDILLLTDGQAWDDRSHIDRLINRAKEQGTRIFCIGVGDNIDDGFLTKLSRETGAQLRRANPHENMARVVASSVEQMRRATLPCSIHAYSKTEWDNDLTSCLAGEHPTYMRVSDSNASLSSFHAEGSELQVAVQEIPKHAFAFEKALVQLIANEQLRTADADEAEQIALAAQIISEHTSFVMVSDQVVEGATGIPEVAHLPQSAPRSMMDYASIPMFSRSAPDVDACYSERVYSSSSEDIRFKRGPSEEVYELSATKSASFKRESYLDFDFLEELLDRRKNRDQNIDFELLRRCGLSSDDCYDLVDSFREAHARTGYVTEEQFIAAYILLEAESEERKLKPSVKARLAKLADGFDVEDYV